MSKADKPVFPARRVLSTGTVLVLTMSLGTGQALAKPAVRTTTSHNAGVEQHSGQHFGWDNPHVTRLVEQSGQSLVDILERTDQSLAAPGQGSAQAANNLGYADDIAKGIALQMPYVLMKDRLEAAKARLQSGATRAFLDDLVPIYSSIDDLKMVSPELATQLKGGLKQAQRLAQSGTRRSALKQMDRVIDGVMASRIDIPIRYVRQQIEFAREALKRDDIDAARKGVEKALGSMIHVVTDDLSVVQAGLPALAPERT
jgi:hypothetical protein